MTSIANATQTQNNKGMVQIWLILKKHIYIVLMNCWHAMVLWCNENFEFEKSWKFGKNLILLLWVEINIDHQRL